MSAPVFLRRRFGAHVAEGITALEVLRWSTPLGSGVRLFFKAGTPLEAFDLETARPGRERFSEIHQLGGGLMLVGSGPAVSGLVHVALKTGELALAASSPEPELFAGLNVALALRNGQSAETVAKWLDYHVCHHRLSGALIIDRAAPGSEPGFAEALAGLDIEGLERLVLCDVPVPLGKPDLPDETHPFNAPDAPGKDRMTLPAPDPWRAPLGEGLVYEIARWRFLSRARAVANIDVSDLLAPRSDVFARVLEAKDGVLRLDGRHVYPWRVRKGAPVCFGDHICRPFDALSLSRRWCVVPARLGAGQYWRFIRIANTDSHESAPFYRAMALRHPGHAAAELVPKSSLVEDRALLELARTVFAHKPVRPPVSPSALSAVPAPAVSGGRTCIITTMKNEGPFILEWLAYHRAIGVEDFLIYTNDCTDGTDALLDLLQRKGLLQHRDNPFRKLELPPQHAALKAAESEPVLQNAGWAICMDVDEFLSIHVGEGRLADLFAAVGDANLISITWRLFGNADIAAYHDRFIIERFTRCAPEFIRKPHQAWGFKTLFRNLQIYKKLGVHRPKGLKPDLWTAIHWVNGSGQPMPKSMLRNGWRSTPATIGYDLVTLNHYAVRSAESFLVKRDRGRVNHVERGQGLAYWFRMNNNAEEDLAIHARLPMLRAEFDRLMADPEIRAAHGLCVMRHKRRIKELKALDDYASFYAEITGNRMKNLSRMHRHFGANVFLAGPDSVPDEIALAGELPADFFFTVGDVEEAAH